jgi:prepilin-type N-terminal cleavage/methylation domain-containing protein
MKGGKNRQPLGYTIIEVMIVLAVSGFMFLIATTFINGKQAHTAFTAGVNEMASQLQDAIQQVNAGEYSDIPLTCTPGSPPQFANSASPSQGTASGCVFVGKFFHFWTNQGPSAYEVFTLGGNRLVGIDPAVSLTDVDPVPVQGLGLDLTVQNTIPQSLQIHSGGTINGVRVVDASGNTHSGNYGFGFIESLGSLAAGGVGATYASGAQAINLVYDLGLTIPVQNEASVIGALTTTPTPLQYARSASICLSDGGQFATISIGDTRSTNLSVNAHILGRAGDATCN